MKFVCGLILAVALSVATSFTAYAATKVVDVRTNKAVQYQQLVNDVKDDNVTFIGEIHDDAEQHKNQLELIRVLYAMTDNLAIGLEAFSTDYQQQLDDWSKGKLDEQEFKAIYAKNWSYDWSLYRDIFIFARDNRIPLIALNVPKAIMSKVVRQGAASLDENDKKALPPRISWNLNPQQVQYMKRIRSQVLGDRPGPFPFSNFAEAQALRNSVMASSIAKFAEKAPDTHVIAITGIWHAVKSGAPEQLKQKGKVRCKVVLPVLPEFNPDNATSDEVDYFILK